MSNKLLESALWYQKQGYSVIPINPKSADGKKPYVKWTQFQSGRASQNQIRQWWEEWSSANIAIVAGAASGIDVVDVDTKAGLDALNEFLPENLVTPIAITPGGGWHYYFKHQKGLVNRARVITDCDVRTDGGYIIVPPSQNGTGKTYAWMEGLSIGDVEPATMPSMLYDVLQAGRACQARYSERIYNTNIHNRGDFKDLKNAADFKRLQVTSGDFKLGERDQALFHLANCLVKGGMGDENILKYMLFFASHCDPPFPEKEILAKIESAKKRNSKADFNIAEEVNF